MVMAQCTHSLSSSSMAVSSSSSPSTPQIHKSNTINMNYKQHKIRNPAKTSTSPLIPKLEPTEEDEEVQLIPPPRKRSKSPGIRLIGRRIYDSVHGKTCHQCRQKTMDFSVTCTNQIDGRKCTLNVCHICLFNRYGEKAEEAAAILDWKCPKCRGVCNCSLCMKKRGHCPTGALLRAAKANGYSSVSDMLIVKGSEMIKEYKGSTSKKRAASNEVEAGVVLTKRKKKNGIVWISDEMLKSEPMKCGSGVEKNDDLKPKKGNSQKKSEKIVTSVSDSSKKQAASSNELANGSAKSHVKGKGLKAKKGTKSPSIMKPKKKNCSNKLEKSNKVDNNGSASVDNVITKKNGKRCRNDLKMTDSDELVPEKISVKIEDDENGVCNNIDVKVSSLKNEIPLPKGTELTKLADIDFPPEDIGNGLQFLEFCEAFGQVLDLKKGQPECLLQKIASSPPPGQTIDLLVAQFHIKLLSIIQENSENGYAPMKTKGRNSWTNALCKFVFESESLSKGLFLGSSSLGPNEYNSLTTSEKLRLLIFLCDEALGTEKLRNWIDEQNVEELKKEKEKSITERDREKNLKKLLQDELVKATLARNGAPLTIPEYQKLVLKIKAEAAQTIAETLESTKKKRTDAVRSEPLFSEDGHKFWKLRSYSNKLGILLQDICNENLSVLQEKWFAYNVQEISMVEQYISSSRKYKDQEMEEDCPSICMVKQEVI